MEGKKDRHIKENWYKSLRIIISNYQITYSHPPVTIHNLNLDEFGDFPFYIFHFHEQLVIYDFTNDAFSRFFVHNYAVDDGNTGSVRGERSWFFSPSSAERWAFWALLTKIFSPWLQLRSGSTPTVLSVVNEATLLDGMRWGQEITQLGARKLYLFSLPGRNGVKVDTLWKRISLGLH